YVQVAMNTVFVGVLIYIVANFITTIQSDVSLRTETLLQRERQRRANCEKEYYQVYRCDKPIGAALFTVCEDRKACMEQPEPRIGRASVAAETFALIVNSFVHTISYKTMVFVLVIVFGGLYISNHAISSYRSNHVMHQQHTVVPPSNSSSSTSNSGLNPPFNPNGSRRNDHSSGILPFPASRDGSAFGRRELSFGNGLSLQKGRGAVGSSSRDLTMRRHESQSLHHDSEDDNHNMEI
ncbi:hypothetical protein BGZ54_006698, partial [Gamsiella multidivaricata]